MHTRGGKWHGVRACTITTILCDLDGTLVDSRLDIAVAFQHAWRTVIGGTPPSATAIAQHIGKPLAEMLCELGGLLSPPLVSAFLTAYRHTYARQDACLSQLYPGVIATLQALSTFTLGIVTTKEPEKRISSCGDSPSAPSFSTSRVVPLICASSPPPTPYSRPSPPYAVRHRTP